MYSIWIDSKKDVYAYLKDKDSKGVKKCYPLAFNINNRIGVDKFKIEEIDVLTSTFDDEQHFFSELLKFGDTYIKETPRNHPFITYHKKDIISDSPVIYNDRLIYLKANEIRRKKEKGKKVLLENDELLKDFISFIKWLARNPISRKYLLDSDSLDDSVSYTSKKALKRLVSDDVKKYLGEINGEAQYKILRRGIRSLLATYVKDYELLEKGRENEASTLTIQEELEQTEKEINLYFREDYRNLREMVAFENQYLEVLKESVKNNNCFSNRFLLSPLIREVILQKEVRNGETEKRVLDDFYLSLENPVAMEKPTFIENEEVRMLLQEGGISAVMEQLDADKIYGSHYHGDIEKLGITKKKKR